MRTILRILMAVVVLWPLAAAGQVNVDAGTTPGGSNGAPAGEGTGTADGALDPEVAARIARYKEQQAQQADPKPATPPAGTVFNAETEASFQRAWQAYYDYRANGYAHRQRVFDWQDVSTKIIFVVVIVLVLAGVYFAAVQFHAGLRAHREAPDAGEVELSFRGIKVRSPVLGVIVLTISLAFFYLYLIYVYPIENVF